VTDEEEMSSMVMKVSYHIDAPVKKVFDYFKDPASDTGPGYELVESKMTEEGVGTYMNWRMRVAGIPIYEGIDVITDLVPDKHITEKSSRAMVGTWDYEFEPEGTGTKLTMTHRPRSFWALPPMSNLVDLTTTRLSKAYIGRVRATLEGKGTPTVPRQQKRTAKPRKPVATA
jgi:hypothetical protein